MEIKAEHTSFQLNQIKNLILSVANEISSAQIASLKRAGLLLWAADRDAETGNAA